MRQSNQITRIESNISEIELNVFDNEPKKLKVLYLGENPNRLEIISIVIRA